MTIDTWFRQRVLHALKGLSTGSLTIVDGGQSWTFGDPASAPRATIAVTSPALYRRVATAGALGAAEAYLRGDWIADDLVAALRVFAANLDAADALDGWPATLGRWRARVAHALRVNTRAGSRRNIRAHYDIGNDLFALFLDDTMTYSCGIFERPDSTLEDASIAKIDRACRKLDLRPEDRLLEIGTGWGALAIHAARHYGCHVTTTTISQAQHDVAAQRIAESGMAHRITLLQQDYRDLTGSFDKLVSIEMIEAVGFGHLDGFFKACTARLAPHGQMLLQGIVMPEHRYASYVRSPDFIQRYVFPGNALPSVGAMTGAIARTTDFRIAHLEDLSPHYAMTLQRWRERFMARLADVRRLGYDDRFIRLWEYYLAYCEAAFAERCTGVVQLLLTRPACRIDAVGAGGHARTSTTGGTTGRVAGARAS
jgi:cyclopropane-fatty-acyl-phospholipid synthase